MPYEKKEYQDSSATPERTESRHVEEGDAGDVVVDEQGSEFVAEISERSMSWQRTAVLL